MGRGSPGKPITRITIISDHSKADAKDFFGYKGEAGDVELPTPPYVRENGIVLSIEEHWLCAEGASVLEVLKVALMSAPFQGVERQ